MASLNKVFLMGNLTKEPELRYIPSGAAVCEFGLAVNRRFTTSAGENKEETCFVDIVVWGKQAENCSRFLQKGSPALIEGRLQMDQWQDRESGKNRSRLRVIAERVQFVGSSQQRDGMENTSRNFDQQVSGAQYAPQPPPPQQPVQSGPQAQPQPAPFPPQQPAQPATGQPPPPPPEAFNVEEEAEDDIPF